METWREIYEFGGLYEVSSEGRVRSRDRSVKARHPSGKEYFYFKKGRMLKPGLGGAGYLVVVLSINGFTKCVNVHDLVAEHFMGFRHYGREICHNNGVKTDNRACNLRYGTPLDNGADRAKHGHVRKFKGMDVPSSKLNDGDIYAIRHRAKKASFRSLGQMFGVHHKTISDIVNRRTWSHI